MWDAAQYLKYSDERSRPFFDLIARVQPARPGSVVDLGCGPGNLTRIMASRWRGVRVLGVDNSPEMLAKAMPLAIAGRLEFVEADIHTWSAPNPVDLIVSNAALHWVGEHEKLLARLAKMLEPGGKLAVQMPYFDNPAHFLIEETKADPRWREKLHGLGLHERSVMPLLWYVERLHDLGFTVDAWQTTYIHVLSGEDPVLEWYKGSALRPLLGVLDPAEREEFLRELANKLRAAYPPKAGVTLLPFPRLFFVGSLER